MNMNIDEVIDAFNDFWSKILLFLNIILRAPVMSVMSVMVSYEERDFPPGTVHCSLK